MTDRVQEERCRCRHHEIDHLSTRGRCLVCDCGRYASSNRVCGDRFDLYVCWKPAGHAGDHENATGHVWHAIPNRVPCFEGCQYGEDGICTQDVSCGRVQADATRNRAAEIEDAYQRGYAAAELHALMMLTWAVEAAGGELTIAPKLTRGRCRLERYDDPAVDTIRLRVVPDGHATPHRVAP